MSMNPEVRQPASQPAAGWAAAGTELIAALDAIPGLDSRQGLAFMGGDCAFYARMLHLFCERHASDAGQLRQLLLAGDLLAAIRTVHSLKGLAGSLGATRLQEQASSLEQLLRAAQHPTGAGRDAAGTSQHPTGAGRDQLDAELDRFGSELAALVQALAERLG